VANFKKETGIWESAKGKRKGGGEGGLVDSVKPAQRRVPQVRRKEKDIFAWLSNGGLEGQNIWY